MFERILLAAALQRHKEPSVHAVEARRVAIILAKGSSRRLYVLTVFDYQELAQSRAVHALPPEILTREKRRITEEVEKKLDGYIAETMAEGLEAIKILREGSPRTEIVKIAEETQADLIVIGSHSKRSVFDVALGGTAAVVSKNAPCPVLMVSPRPRTKS